MPSPPKKLSLDGQSITIQYPKRLGALREGYAKAGDFDPRTKVIRILSSSAGNTRIGERCTLVHELLHYMVDRAGLKLARRQEEAFCDAVDVYLLHLLRENPDLVEYLTEEF